MKQITWKTRLYHVYPIQFIGYYIIIYNIYNIIYILLYPEQFIPSSNICNYEYALLLHVASMHRN